MHQFKVSMVKSDSSTWYKLTLLPKMNTFITGNNYDCVNEN